MKDRGQFSIIAALLVAVVLITTVMVTYSTIRNSPVQNQSPILSAIDETNLAIKQILGFTVGYYGSVLQVTGNVSYARMLALNYLQSGLQNVANMHPEWGTSLSNTSTPALQAYWFTNTSYSSGNLAVTYSLAGLGILGVNYQTSCKLGVQILNSVNGQASINITQDRNEPLVTLGKQNFNFYRYNNASSAWEPVNPNTEPTAYPNGTYHVNMPSGTNPYSYIVQIKDQRGIITVASSFNSYTCALAWNSTSVQAGSPSAQYYVNTYNSSVDSFPDKGTHSNFVAQQNTDSVYDNMTEGDVPVITTAQTFAQSNSTNGQIGTWSNFTTEQYADNINDTLTEGDVPVITTAQTYVQANSTNTQIGTWSNFTTEQYSDGTYDTLTEANTVSNYTYCNGNSTSTGWINPSYAYNNKTADGASITWATSGYCAPLRLNLTSTAKGTLIQYFVNRNSMTVTTMEISVANQTGAWTLAYSGTPTYGAYANATLTATFTYTAMEFNFTSSGITSRTVCVNETQAINATVTPLNYQLSLEEQWNPSPYSANLTKTLCIRTGANNTAEFLRLDWWNTTSSAWLNINSSLVNNAWNNITVTNYLTASNFTIRFSDGTPNGDTVQSTWQIDCVLLYTQNSTDNYQLSLEEQWNPSPYSANLTKTLCIRTGANNTAEFLRLDWWNTTSSAWLNINSSLVNNAWNNITVTNYLTASNFTIRFSDGTPNGDTVQSTWQIDCVLLYTQNSTDNYQLSLEEQWTNANYTNAQLCIRTGSLSAEAIAVEAWNVSAGAWTNILSSLNANRWNNVTVSAYLQPQNFTIRFKGTNEISDPVQDRWQIDAALLAVWPTADLYSLSRQGTIVAELLQNGTMRWLGQNLLLTNSNSTLPFPPVPVKSIHVNETINGVNSEVPFQIEDWSSAYRIPLGLTSNMSIFSSRTMIVFLATPNASKATIWWNGSDTASQTPYAYTNRYFNDTPSSGKLSNGLTTLQLQSNFVVTSTVGNSSATSNFMRINNNASSYGSDPSYVITNGTVRDIIHQEAEWGNEGNGVYGVTNCSDIYSDIVLTLPANTTYYTYQLRLMFVQSQQNKTISDLRPILLISLTGQIQTENGTISGLPIVSNATDLFYNYSASSWAHHWSQSVSATKGAGIIFTDSANQNLYVFDSITGIKTGAINTNSTGTIQVSPVAKSQLSFNTTLDPRMQDIVWYGAVVTFDTTTPINNIPIYNNNDQTGLWMIAEYPPTVAVTTENYQ